MDDEPVAATSTATTPQSAPDVSLRHNAKVIEFNDECRSQSRRHQWLCWLFVIGGSLLFIRLPGIDDDLNRTAPLGLLSLMIATYFGFNAARRRRGRLVLSDESLDLEPEWCGFSLQWSSIEKWQYLTYESGEAPDVLVWGHRMRRPFIIPADWMSAGDLQLLLTRLTRAKSSISPKASKGITP